MITIKTIKKVLLTGLIFINLVNADSRQLGTGAVIQIEGSSGSGLIPWATIAGYSEEQESNFNVALSVAKTNDFDLNIKALSWSWANRVELSYAQQNFDIHKLSNALDLPDSNLRQDVFGLKVRLVGNLVYTKLPQIALGIQYKSNKQFRVPEIAGAQGDSGVDIYLSATKLFLSKPGGYNGFVTANLRSSKANEIGLMGFGGDLNNSRKITFESSIGFFINKKTAIGVEYRQKKSNLGFASESNWKSIYTAWIPNRRISITFAYVDLGTIATLKNQNGFYLSFNGSF